ncbi:aminobenzoate synthetase [alpha proteobacterium AAP81b]|nr:aminobenzoate synthetase [alpha proteobacterium AAP81b]
MLDDAAAGRARLFTGVVETLIAETADAVRPALERLRDPGPWAGYLAYEAGLALEPRLAGLVRPAGDPLLWFGRFAEEHAVADVAALLGEGPAAVGVPRPAITRADYEEALARVLALIAAGDIYQTNLTFAAEVAVSGHPLPLYARLRAGSRAPWGALVFTGARWLLSFSPELFFTLKGRQLTARPMKGTARRGGDAAADAVAAAALAADPKNRAENLMIVDLLRNDLSRVASDVAVPALFEVEAYPTILQMTSTITATARPGIAAADVLAATFPCGSVTGAPKIRAMEIIAAVETEPRGAYTGSIGAIDAAGDATFNVAIRTLTLAPGAGVARLGLGSGIVADSDAIAEWAECFAKAAFLARRGSPDLIETMRVVGGELPDLDRHLDRMATSAAYLGHRFDRARLAATARAAARGDGRLRLLLAPSGAAAAQASPPPPPLPDPVLVALAALPVAEDDWRLRHKTSDRAFYDDARRAAGTAEVIFVAPDGSLTEGSFTSLFVPRGGRLLTPDGPLLPGILRARLIAEGRAVPAPLTAADLAGGFFIGNALRGLLPARLRS